MWIYSCSRTRGLEYKRICRSAALWSSASAALRPQVGGAMRLTLVARVSDGLPLAASMEDEKEHRQMDDYKTQAKKIVKRLNSTSPPRISIESGGSYFQCAARPRDGVRMRQRSDRSACGTVISTRTASASSALPRRAIQSGTARPAHSCPHIASDPHAGCLARLAFNYLEELQSEFMGKYRDGIETASRPYAFIKFGAACLHLQIATRDGTRLHVHAHMHPAPARRHLYTEDEEDVRRHSHATQPEQNE